MSIENSSTAVQTRIDNSVGQLAAEVAHLILMAGLGLENSVRALGIATKTVTTLVPATRQASTSGEAITEIFADGFAALVLGPEGGREYPMREDAEALGTSTERARYQN